MKIKKITAFVLALGLILSMSGCNNSKDSSSQSESSSTESSDSTDSTDSSESEPEELTYDDLDDGIIMSIDGFDVSEDEYKYYFAYAKSYIDDGDDTYWDDDADSSKLNDLKKQTLDYIFNSYTVYVLAKANGVELTDEEKAECNAKIDSTKLYYETQNAGEKFEDYLKSVACTLDIYKESLIRSELEYKTVKALYESDFRENYLKDYAHVKYIVVNPVIDENNTADLITINPDLTYTDEETAVINKLNGFAKAADKESLQASVPELMDIIHARLEAGESMDTLIEKYSFNPDEQKNDEGTCIGSYITADAMQKDFSDQAFALEENSISAPFSSTGYGYYIVQRLPFDEDYLKDNIITMFMDSESYPYMSRYEALCRSTQLEMKIVYDHKYDDIKADYATAYTVDESSSTDTTATSETESSETTKASETAALSETKKPE